MKSFKTTCFAFFLAVFVLGLAVLPTHAQEARQYVVKPGDTLYSIANSHGLTVQELSELNGLENGVIRAGMELRVGVLPAESSPESAVLPTEVERLASPLNSGLNGLETVASIAARLEISEDDLFELNPEIEDVISRLNRISPTEDRTSKSYVVKAGDTMFSIAKANGLSVAQLSDLNSLTSSAIRSGQKLNIPGSEPMGSSTWTSLGVVDAVSFPETYQDRLMASELVYNDLSFVIGHTTLPIGTLIMVGRPNEGPSILCIVADESLSVSMDIVDVSAAVAAAVGLDENERVEIFTLK